MVSLMFVDQDPLIGKAYARVLKEHCPSVQYLGQAFDFSSGKEKALSERPDILISDICISSVCSLQLVKEIKKELPDCCQIVLSANEQLHYIQEVVNLGIAHYLEKPLGMSEFLKILYPLCETKTEGAGKENLLSTSPLLFVDAAESASFLLSGNINAFQQQRNQLKERLSRVSSEEEFNIRLICYSADLLRELNRIRKDSVLSLLFHSFLNRIVSVTDRNELLDHFDIFTDQLIHSFSENSEKKARQLVTRIQKTAELHMNEPLSLEQISAELYFSTSYVSRTFKRITGENFSDYLSARRLEKAKALLITTELSITQIADMVGYENTNSFRRFFKNKTGVSATDYRKLNARYRSIAPS